MGEHTNKEHGIYIDKRTNSCIFSFDWDGTDSDIINFIDEAYAKFIPKLRANRCEGCGRMLSVVYAYIIEMLNKNDLLPKSFVPMCCYCNILACVGFYISDEWESTHISEGYSNVRNIAFIHITGFHIPTKEHFSFILKIDDIDLALKTGRVFNDVGCY